MSLDLLTYIVFHLRIFCYHIGVSDTSSIRRN
jgi:hypothetical protein